ncbi:hypothetical protein EDD11_005322 [Mortierella claussenii]|nr:hypothetical protein EDD11_005322 [Mortierella claussenii]
MGSSSCYTLLKPARVLIALLTLYSFVSISIGRKISLDKAASLATSSSPPHANATTTPPPVQNLATEDFFKDSAHLGINITVLIGCLCVLYAPRPNYWWWFSNRFRRHLLTWTFAALALSYGISCLTSILKNYMGGCQDSFFDNTRSRCFIQYSVSTSEIVWAVLLVIEGKLAVKQLYDRKWFEQNAEEEVASAVLYRPDLTLLVTPPTPTDTTLGRAGTTTVPGTTSTGEGNGLSDENAIELIITSNTTTSRLAGQQHDNHEEEEEQPPEYSRRRPRDQLRIVDTAHLPAQLEGAVVRALQQSSSLPRDVSNPVLAGSATSLVPPYTPADIAPFPLSTTAATATTNPETVVSVRRESLVDPVAPPPSYRP